MKKPIIASNWKMYKDRDEALEFLEELTAKVDSEDLKSHFLFFPPAILLGLFDDGEFATDFTGEFNFGPQNIHAQKEGAFTGENSIVTAKSYGAKYTLIGHSERRQYNGETSETCAAKIRLTLEEGLIPVYCIGESLADREADKTLEALEAQLEKGLTGLNDLISQAAAKSSAKSATKKSDLDISAPILIAYEPVWAIGTGKVATSQQASDAHDFIRTWLTKKFGETTAKSILILYGGSVKPDNTKELSQQKNIDGFLIGSASLKVESLVAIYNQAK